MPNDEDIRRAKNTIPVVHYCGKNLIKMINNDVPEMYYKYGKIACEHVTSTLNRNKYADPYLFINTMWTRDMYNVMRYYMKKRLGLNSDFIVIMLIFILLIGGCTLMIFGVYFMSNFLIF